MCVANAQIEIVPMTDYPRPSLRPPRREAGEEPGKNWEIFQKINKQCSRNIVACPTSWRQHGVQREELMPAKVLENIYVK